MPFEAQNASVYPHIPNIRTQFTRHENKNVCHHSENKDETMKVQNNLIIINFDGF